MDIHSNKKLVLDLYKNVVRERNSDLIDHYIDDTYIQHSPSMKDGKAGLREAIEYLKQLPKPKEQKSPIVLAIAEGDYVMLLLDLNLMGTHLSVSDLFKVIDGKIVEHWDVKQDITSKETNVPIFEVDTNAVMNDDDKAAVKKHLNHRQLKVHRMITEGDVVGAQSEVQKSGKRFVSYDFIKVVNSQIVQAWSVEQEIPELLYHTNGMI